MGRARRRYVRDDEVKLAERTPVHGELVLARFHGHKSYFVARYDAGLLGFVKPRFVRTGSSGYILAAYVMGWLPAAGNISTGEINRHGGEQT